jgi:hypothetical protein
MATRTITPRLPSPATGASCGGGCAGAGSATMSCRSIPATSPSPKHPTWSAVSCRPAIPDHTASTYSPSDLLNSNRSVKQRIGSVKTPKQIEIWPTSRGRRSGRCSRRTCSTNSRLPWSSGEVSAGSPASRSSRRRDQRYTSPPPTSMTCPVTAAEPAPASHRAVATRSSGTSRRGTACRSINGPPPPTPHRHPQIPTTGPDTTHRSR